jgi:hypothetical protein
MQSRAALGNIVDHLRSGAPMAAIGGKWPAPWTWPLRAWVADLHAPFVTDFTGFDRPWRLLGEVAPDLRVRELAFGAGYLALGHTPQHRRGTRARRAVPEHIHDEAAPSSTRKRRRPRQ